MVTIANGEWVADLGTMTCRNIANKVVVGFEKSGKTLIGKIKYIPIELFLKRAGGPHGEKRIQKMVMEAEDVFMRAYFESDIEKNGIRKEMLE